MASGILSISRTGSTPSYVSFSSLWASTPNATTNTSTLSIQIVARNTSSQFYVSGSTCTTGVTVRANNSTGELKSQTVTLSLSPNSSQTIYTQSFTIHHDAEGNASITMSASVSGGITGTGAGTATLDQIQRGATAIVSLASKTETGATINWATDSAIDYFWYKINSGNWVANGSVSGTSGSFTLTGLTHNTSYTVTIKVRKASNQVQTESDALPFTTYSYPYATSMPNFNIGSTLSVGLYNPLNRSVSVKLQDANGNQMGSQSTSGTTASGYAGASVVTALYGSIPNAKSGTYKIAVTYGGHTETRTGGKYYTVEADCKPELNTPTYRDSSNNTITTGNDQIIVQNKSTPEVTVTGLASKKSATIASVTASIPGQTITLTVSGTSATGTFTPPNSAVNMTCTVTITDSRGYSTSKTVTMTVAAYFEPKVTVKAHRHNNYYSDTDVTVDVEYAQIGNNQIGIGMVARSDNDTISDTLLNGVTATYTMDNEEEWTIGIAVFDGFGTTVTTVVYLSKGMPIIFFDKDKYSVGINCFPSHDETLEVDGAVLNRNVMTAIASAAHTSGTSSQQITLTAGETVGDQLTIDSGGVKIGSKVSKVLVSVNVNSLSVSAGNHGVTIKNGAASVAYAYRTMTATPNSESISIAPVLLSVAANDTLSVYVSGYASTEYVSVQFTVEAMA